MSQTLAVPERKLEARNFLKFRCRMDSAIGADAHRSFSGVYYPRWRSLYLDEVREIGGRVKLYPVFELDVMYKADGDYYYSKDFVEGARLRLGRSNYSRDEAAKVFVITYVDDSSLYDDAVADQAYDARRTAAAPPTGVQMAAEMLRQAIRKRSGSIEAGIKDAGKLFRAADASGNRLMDRQGFAALLQQLQFEDFPRDLADVVFSSFDQNADGAISYEEFLDALRPPLSEARKRVIIEAFTKIDADRDGYVTVKELSIAFNPAAQSEVLQGQMTEHQTLNLFMARWDVRAPNARVPFAEFSDLYNGVSATIDSDAEFVNLVRASWRL